MITGTELIEKQTANLIKEKLSLCTEQQQAFFHRIYKESGGFPKPKDYDTALNFIMRTLNKNNKSL